jgi:MarR family transcriptional regulator for hemolysin
MGIFSKIRSVADNRTTYRVGLLQAKAFRILKQRTNEALSQFGITSIEWALLGLLADHENMNMRDVAAELGVEAPYVTEMVKRLNDKDFITLTRDTVDTRVKNLSLTKEGATFVKETELVVRNAMRHMAHGLGVSDLLGYINFLFP